MLHAAMDRWIPHSQTLDGRHVVVKPGQLLVDNRPFRVDGACRLDVEERRPRVLFHLGLLAASAVGLCAVHALQSSDVVNVPWLIAVPSLAGVIATWQILAARTTYALVLCRGPEHRWLLTTDDASLAPVVESLVREAAALAEAPER